LPQRKVDPASEKRVMDMLRRGEEISVAIASKCGVSVGFVAKLKARLKAQGVVVKNHFPNRKQYAPEPVETSEVSDSVWKITLPRTRISTLDELLEHCKVDLALWEVAYFTVNKWEGVAYDHVARKGKLTKTPKVCPLFQVKATLKKRPGMDAALKEIAQLKIDAKKNAPKPPRIIRPAAELGRMLEIAMFDAHFGKLAWTPETNGPNYDLAIAKEIYLRAFHSLLERSNLHRYEQVIFPIGQDMFNSDNLESMTTKGTRVSSDSRFQKMFQTVRRLMVGCVEELRAIAPVKVIVVPGNHDTLAAWCLGDSLECWFNKYKDVEIDNRPTLRKYHEFGQVLLGFTHGDKGKRTGYPLLMATEASAAFGRCRFREFHTGHHHTTKLDEQNGVRVRTLPSLSPADGWHAENGFVGNLRNGEAYDWDRREGLIAQYYYNDDCQPEIGAKKPRG
jgi:hypothetical protein